jgi:hypothetical protein
MRIVIMFAAMTATLGICFASANAYFNAKPAPTDYCYRYAICK